MTDGSIVFLGDREIKRFDVKDGLGIRLLLDTEIEVAMITSRSSRAVARRAKELGVHHLFQGVTDKKICVRRLASILKIARSEIAAMGDDLPDLEMFAECGVKLAVADAAPEVRSAADWISSHPGGHGAVREAAELILKARVK